MEANTEYNVQPECADPQNTDHAAHTCGRVSHRITKENISDLYLEFGRTENLHGQNLNHIIDLLRSTERALTVQAHHAPKPVDSVLSGLWLTRAVKAAVVDLLDVCVEVGANTFVPIPLALRVFTDRYSGDGATFVVEIPMRHMFHAYVPPRVSDVHVSCNTPLQTWAPPKRTLQVLRPPTDSDDWVWVFDARQQE